MSKQYQFTAIFRLLTFFNLTSIPLKDRNEFLP
ncbi:hypothetical protein CY0110_19782 [Crocosphaera chwakensis CCY0110]|uniref:Uncharacterized protein n=1 Tax=Crocosphaera chwakensis CCY0110 TaxID=391612 RepID=A3IJT8_9CHRO|nr:hypothetical protein CY0110_19782 [Crocosphaera chwakensis CCY0110]